MILEAIDMGDRNPVELGLLEVCLAYEKWEGDLVMSDEAWDGGIAEFPTITAELWDRLLEIQAMRNKAVRAARGDDR